MATKAQSPSNLVVLLVEDQMAMRKIIKTVLQHIGVKVVIEASDGLEAYQLLRQRNISRQQPVPKSGFDPRSAKIDFIIADWRMPKMTGLELLQEVRRDSRLCELPFMMLTAENDSQQIQEAIRLGVNDYIVKPFTSRTLESKLERLVKELRRT